MMNNAAKTLRRLIRTRVLFLDREGESQILATVVVIVLLAFLLLSVL